MKIDAIEGSFAKTVTALPLWESMNADNTANLQRAFTENPLLVFRRQSLEEDELLNFASLIGDPVPYAEQGWRSRYREVVLLSNMRNAAGDQIGGLANQELIWHTDQSFYAEPITGSILYAVVLPEQGGQTSWADLYGAYDALPATLKKFLDGAIGTFSYASRAYHNEYKGDNVSREKRIKSTPDVRHPLVNTNPATGRKSIYIDPKTVTGIDGMPDDEAEDLLSELFEAATRPGNIYHHKWQVGALVLWDNATLIHRRDPFPETEHRLVKRMILRLPAERHAIPPAIA